MLQLFTTFACMSRCVDNAPTYLDTPSFVKELTYANPLPAMAYTRCWATFFTIKLWFVNNNPLNTV